VKTWFQAFAFKYNSMRRYTLGDDGFPALRRRGVGAVESKEIVFAGEGGDVHGGDAIAKSINQSIN
jgi:hypothetical protein